MKPQALLVTLAVVAVLAALPLAESQERPLCCNDCGVCNRKSPPECFCRDASPRGCHPACKNCEKFTSSDGEHTIFQCQDRITNFCQRRCDFVVGQPDIPAAAH